MGEPVQPSEPIPSAATIDLPPWVPPSIAAFVSRGLEIEGLPKSPETVLVLNRLITDPRMRRVWNELQRRKRKDYRRTEDFLHNVTLSRCFESEPSDGLPTAIIAACTRLRYEADYGISSTQDLGMVLFF